MDTGYTYTHLEYFSMCDNHDELKNAHNAGYAVGLKLELLENVYGGFGVVWEILRQIHKNHDVFI